MSLIHIPLTIIVAATAKNGIGKDGGLPWPLLKKDMAYFSRVTKRVILPKDTGSLQSDNLKAAILDGTRQNAIIMGRKTWDSIPAKLRPLKDRTNIVITTQSRAQLQPIPDDVIVTSDILSGLNALDEQVTAGTALSVGRAFVIGGSSIYRAALKLPQTNRILLTRVHKDYDCDTFFPLALEKATSQEFDAHAWRLQTGSVLQAYVGEAIDEAPTTQEVDGVQIRLNFELWEQDP